MNALRPRKTTRSDEIYLLMYGEMRRGLPLRNVLILISNQDIDEICEKIRYISRNETAARLYALQG